MGLVGDYMARTRKQVAKMGAEARWADRNKMVEFLRSYGIHTNFRLWKDWQLEIVYKALKNDRRTT